MTDAPVIDPAEVTLPLRLLDMRDAASFAAGHARGAVRVPIEDWVAAARTAKGDFTNTGSGRMPSMHSASGRGPLRASTMMGG